MKESDFHAWLKRAVPPGEGVFTGIGDDAAVVAGADRIAVASDLLVEGVHFSINETPPEKIGAKAVNRNFSDMAAMGLEPHWILASAALPEGTAETFVHSLVEGMVRAAKVFGASLVGGDTSASKSHLVIDVAVISRIGAHPPITRAGAKPGDALLVTGELGGSALGKHLDFTPRVREGVFLNAHYKPTSMIDISDGLSLDLHRVLDASNVGVRLYGDTVPVSDAAKRLAADTGRPALGHALTDGEDFELLFTLSPGQAQRLIHDKDRFFEVTEIGEVVHDPALRSLEIEGKIEALESEGYDHTI